MSNFLDLTLLATHSPLGTMTLAVVLGIGGYFLRRWIKTPPKADPTESVA